MAEIEDFRNYYILKKYINECILTYLPILKNAFKKYATHPIGKENMLCMSIDDLYKLAKKAGVSQIIGDEDNEVKEDYLKWAMSYSI